MHGPGQSADGSAHVRLQDTGIRFEAVGESLTYDDVSHQILAVQGQDVIACSLLPGKAPQVTHVGDGPPIRAVRASANRQMLAVQRSPLQLQFVHCTSGKMFVQGSHQRSSPVLGSVWTRSGEVDFVMVTPTGLELFALAGDGQGLRYLDARRHPIKWHMYSHETRVVLLGTGEIGLWLQAYQFTSDGIIKLPPFQIAATTPTDSARAPPLSALNPDDIALMTMYGRIYCSYIDQREQRLYLYRFYKDAVMLQHQYELLGKHVRLAVANNLLLVHHRRPDLVSVIDVCATTGDSLVAPQPIAVAPAASAETSAEGPDFAELRYQLPNLVLDPQTGVVWRCVLDLAAIASVAADRTALVAFLQRRRPDHHAVSLVGSGGDIKALTLSVVKGMLVERQPLQALRLVFDAVNLAYADYMRLHPSPSPSTPTSQPRAIPAVTPQEMTAEVLRWLHREEATDAQYLQAAVAEYIASAEAHRLAAPPALHTLALDIALQQDHAAQAVALLATQPSLDSAILAEHLQGLARSGALPEAAKLACDMWARLGMLDKVCRMLLREGSVLEAMRLARRHAVVSIPEASFLQAAAKTGDLGTFTAVYRACHQAAPQSLPPYAEALSQHERFFQQSCALGLPTQVA